MLRVLSDNEGRPTSAYEVNQGLMQVQADLRDGPTLSRGGERNLLRNSQQYWKAVGLLDTTTGGIALTPFGRKVAGRKITQDAFAERVIRTFVLPNPRVENAATMNLWRANNLTIYPLVLLLRVLLQLHHSGRRNAHLSVDEVAKVIVPLSGIGADIDTQASHVLRFRVRPQEFTHFPNCVERPNDRRMVGEFLLFLAFHGFVRKRQNTFELRYENPIAVEEMLDLPVAEETLASGSERRRTKVEVLARPGQPRFRRDVLAAANSRCLMTRESIPNVLEACHIIPVSQQGGDEPTNGFCMRSDIHDLFDSGHLHISENGDIAMSEAMEESPVYSQLPSHVEIPEYVGRANVRWRWAYQ